MNGGRTVRRSRPTSSREVGLHEWIPLMLGTAIGALHARSPMRRHVLALLLVAGACLATLVAGEGASLVVALPRDLVLVAGAAAVTFALPRWRRRDDRSARRPVPPP
jgi:peptidoglycan/LPS O-acetylase OafA/YrhL